MIRIDWIYKIEEIEIEGRTKGSRNMENERQIIFLINQIIIRIINKFTQPNSNIMKTKNFIAFAMAGFFGLAMITSCGGGKSGDQATTDNTAVEEKSATAELPEPTAAQMEEGKKIYETPGKCITCHGADGKGVPNVFPTLVGSEFLLNNKARAVEQVLNGSAEVGNKTVKYPAPMPPQLDNKEQAVAVINYVLNSFGNHGGVVTMDDVKDVPIDPR